VAVNGNMTVQQLLDMTAGTPTALVLDWQLATSFSERYKLVRKAVDNCYIQLNESRHIYKREKTNEDLLSLQVIGMLKSAGIHSEHDPQLGGHVDIVVRGKDNFLWIGEAKIYNGPAYLTCGFSQLSDRYGSAQNGRNEGEIVIYCWDKNAWKCLAKWEKRVLTVAAHLDVKITVPLESKSLEFWTSHNCPTTGINFDTRHKIVPLYFPTNQ
jgi:hypothetical protein